MLKTSSSRIPSPNTYRSPHAHPLLGEVLPSSSGTPNLDDTVVLTTRLPDSGNTVVLSLAEKLLRARQAHEPQLPPDQLSLHEGNQVRIQVAVEVFRNEFKSNHPDGTPAAFRAEIEASIGLLLENAQFDPSPYLAKGDDLHGYGKYLLFSDDNQGHPYCFQYFHFQARQKTPIHDHPCACSSYVVLGNLRERHYIEHDGNPLKINKEDRSPGSLRSIDVEAVNIHSIKNSSDTAAGSLHVYRMDGVVQNTAVRRRYAPAPKKTQLDD